jgi:hypothetical protein
MRLLLLSTTMLLFSILATGQANKTNNRISSETLQEVLKNSDYEEFQQKLGEFQFNRERSENDPDSTRTYEYPSPVDSVNHERTVYQHNGNETTEIYYSWNEAESDWDLSSKIYLMFNEAGYFLEYISYSRDTDNNEWVPIQRVTQEFNDYLLVTLFSVEEWDADNEEWLTDQKSVLEYNVDQLLSTNIHWEWSDESGSAEIEFKIEYDYTDFDSIAETTTYSHDGNTYNLDELEERTYGDDQYLDQKTVSWWNSVLELWQFDYKWEYAYNSDMLISERERFTYDAASFEWNEDELYEYSYNEDNLVSALLDHDWDDDASSYAVDDKAEWYYNDTLVTTYIEKVYSSTEGGLENYYKEEYAYNENHKETLFAHYDWDPQDDEWVPDDKTTTQYNEYGDESVVSNYVEDAATGNWELDNRRFWYYDLATNIVANSSNAFDLEVYPNPARNQVNLTASLDGAEDVSVAIYNQVGEEIFSKRLENYSGKETIHWNSADVPSGIYIAEFTTEDERLSRKIVVK